MIKIIQAGICLTIQDGGRHGWRSSGISSAGAMDFPSMSIANLLTGNPHDQAVLEITLGQFCAEFSRDCWIALTGADCHALLCNGQPVWTGWRTLIRKGQRLTLAVPRRGVRSYLAVSGGFDLTEVLGSYSTDLQSRTGGIEGRRLQKGDVLHPGNAGRDFSASCGVRQWVWGNRVRILPGPEYDEFSTESKSLLIESGWRLSSQSNRMGLRLQGPALQRRSQRELLSHGVLPGTIQLPPGGQPVVLMADAQTTGGYPRIASVIEADLWQLAQLRPGESVYFEACGLEEACRIATEQKLALQRIAQGLLNED